MIEVVVIVDLEFSLILGGGGAFEWIFGGPGVSLALAGSQT